mgnify:CR=1 FL=1
MAKAGLEKSWVYLYKIINLRKSSQLENFMAPLTKTRTSYFVYLLKCGDGTLYAGITTDLKRRLKEHACGQASAYTRAKLPVACVYRERHPDRSSATKRELEIKSWSRKKNGL